MLKLESVAGMEVVMIKLTTGSSSGPEMLYIFRSWATIRLFCCSPISREGANARANAIVVEDNFSVWAFAKETRSRDADAAKSAREGESFTNAETRERLSSVCNVCKESASSR